MSAPPTTSRPRRVAQGKLAITTAPAGEQIELSEEERKLIIDFRRMGRASRTMLPKFACRIADLDAEHARKVAPVLRLVSGGSR